MEGFLIKRVDDLAEAKFYWQKFVAQKTIFDNWDFRYCFYKYFNFPLYFQVGYFGGEPVGLMPLQYNEAGKYFEWFGDRFMEDNKVSVQAGSEHLIPDFYANLPGKSKLDYIAGDDRFTGSLPVLDQKYFLNLDGLADADDYLKKYFDSESRGKIRRKLKKISQEKIEVTENNFADIELLIQFNIDRFGASSTFNWPHRQEIFRDILKLPLKIFLNSFFLDGRPQAVSLSILYEGDYAFVNFGVSQTAFPNFNSFVNWFNIDQAIKSGAKSFNAFTGDYGWKELWHLEKSPAHVYHN